jgi:plastocyanin
MASTRGAATLGRLEAIGGWALAALAAAPLLGQASPPAPPPTYTLAGRVELLAKGQATRDRSADPRDAVVTFAPSGATTAPTPVRAEMVTRKKEFVPHLLVVPVGSTVAFPNQDPILHNVFSVSGDNKFDLGLAGKGSGRPVHFRAAGLVRVFCNVHHSMVAYVLVVDTPYWTRPAADGSFSLAGLPGGPGKLTVWHERAEPGASSITLPARAPATVRLEIVIPRVPTHLNKLGQPYASRSGDYE